jgi:hypothetical protein
VRYVPQNRFSAKVTVARKFNGVKTGQNSNQVTSLRFVAERERERDKHPSSSSETADRRNMIGAPNLEMIRK